MGNKQITPQHQLQAILRNDFKSFVIKVLQTVSNDTYLDNWHADVVCNEIEQMINGQNTRLIVNLPPRNMKSIICSVALPAYLLANCSRMLFINCYSTTYFVFVLVNCKILSNCSLDSRANPRGKSP